MKGKKILGYVFLLISIICAVIGIGLLTLDGMNKNTKNVISSNFVENNKISYEKFSKIETGMTYEEVVEIIGEEGKVLSENNILDDEKYNIVMYYWYAENGIANANVTFQGGRVVSKAQIGL